MADFYKHCNWYTVWDAKTGDLIASGTSAMVARRLGYKSTAAFTTHYAHTQTQKPKKPYKYIMRRELVERREAELPPPRTRGKARKKVCALRPDKKKEPARAPTRTSPTQKHCTLSIP